MCLDIEFMLGIKNSFYWRICWGIITPLLMIAVFFYSFITTDRLMFGRTYEYPEIAYSELLSLFNGFVISNENLIAFSNIPLKLK